MNSDQLMKELKITSRKLSVEPLEALPLGELRGRLRNDMNSKLQSPKGIEDTEIALVEYSLLSILDDLWPLFSGMASTVISREYARKIMRGMGAHFDVLSNYLEKGDILNCYKACSEILAYALQILREGEE
jgi:hypothetical protein